jgi:hypothetical protein
MKIKIWFEQKDMSLTEKMMGDTKTTVNYAKGSLDKVRTQPDAILKSARDNDKIQKIMTK